jgi:hypothetical protein
MQIKTLLATIALSLAPGLAMAQGCDHGGKAETASSCMAGATWDEAKAACVANPTS